MKPISTIKEYIAAIPDDRRVAFENLHQTIHQAIDPRFNEQINYGMIGWVVSKDIYPAGYHVDPKLPVPFLNLANQQNYIALYHLGLYADPDLLAWFTGEYKKTGLKLDMGKSCIRFKKIEQIPHDLIAELVSRTSLDAYLTLYRSALKK